VCRSCFLHCERHPVGVPTCLPAGQADSAGGRQPAECACYFANIRREISELIGGSEALK
jgi:hypothetical protein